MEIINSISELRKFRNSLNGNIGFVPTMGALHQGHLSLLNQAKQNHKHVFVSIFINPTQFNDPKDFDRYPRTLESDCRFLEQTHSSVIVFAPSAREMYPAYPPTTWIEELHQSQGLCGEFRPGHFRGVATVVGMLFNIVRPDTAFFGQKDAQQCAVIIEMVKNLHVPIKLEFGETIRESDGLAMSSRNTLLTNEDRKTAGKIPEILSRVASGACSRAQAKLDLSSYGILVQYLEERKFPAPLGTRLCFAGFVGNVRLIDNWPIN